MVTVFRYGRANSAITWWRRETTATVKKAKVSVKKTD